MKMTPKVQNLVWALAAGPTSQLKHVTSHPALLILEHPRDWSLQLLYYTSKNTNIKSGINRHIMARRFLPLCYISAFRVKCSVHPFSASFSEWRWRGYSEGGIWVPPVVSSPAWRFSRFIYWLSNLWGWAPAVGSTGGPGKEPGRHRRTFVCQPVSPKFWEKTPTGSYLHVAVWCIQIVTE